MITGRWRKPSEVLLDLVVEEDGTVRGVANPGRQNERRPFYSYRNAMTGSTLVARRAGIAHATKATTTSSSVTPANVLRADQQRQAHPMRLMQRKPVERSHVPLQGLPPVVPYDTGDLAQLLRTP